MADDQVEEPPVEDPGEAEAMDRISASDWLL